MYKNLTFNKKRPHKRIDALEPILTFEQKYQKILHDKELSPKEYQKKIKQLKKDYPRKKEKKNEIL